MEPHTDGIVPLKNAIQSPPVDLSSSIPTQHLEQKTVLITGGASGIGAALSSFLAEHGANVIIGDVNEEQGTALVARMRQLSSNPHHHFIRLDVSDWASQLAFFKTASTLSPHGGVDCVVANAGINDSSESEAFELNIPQYSKAEAPPPPRMKTLQVNLDGVLYTATLALSYLSENPDSKSCSIYAGRGPRDRHLLLVSSIAGFSALAGSSIYAVAKHGVVGLFRTLRLTAPIVHGVRVNMLCPQYVETPIHGLRGAVVLTGVAKTRMDDVVSAATRLIADSHIIGRALLSGTRGSMEQVRAAGLDSVPNRDKEGAIWDIYGHDFEQTDQLARRVIALLNLASKAKGWASVARDIFHFVTTAVFATLQALSSLFGVRWSAS